MDIWEWEQNVNIFITNINTYHGRDTEQKVVKCFGQLIFISSVLLLSHVFISLYQWSPWNWHNDLTNRMAIRAEIENAYGSNNISSQLPRLI